MHVPSSTAYGTALCLGRSGRSYVSCFSSLSSTYFFFFFSLASDACRSASKLTLHCTDLFLAPPQIWGLQPFLSVQTPSQWVLCVTCDGNLPEAFVRGHIRWNGRRSSGGVCCSFILFYPLLDCSLSSSFLLLLRQRPIRSLEPFHSMWR